jgi:hypothetical protein
LGVGQQAEHQLLVPLLLSTLRHVLNTLLLLLLCLG